MKCSLIAVLAGVITLAGVAPAAEAPIAAKLAVNAEQAIRDVPPLWLGHNMEWVWGGQHLFKTDGSGPVAGVVPLVADLKPGLIRYPGGTLANTFRWADSIGTLAQRKPVANFFTVRGSWKDKVTYSTEKPLLGFDDFMGFVAATRAKGAIVIVNCTAWPKNPELSGTAQEAAAWVAYANARLGDKPVPIGEDERKIDWKDSQHWAALRAKNGHPEPYNVIYWEIGNEVYDAAQGAGVTAADYAERVNAFARLMKSVDPALKIGTVTVWDQPKWNEPVIKGAADGKGLVDFLIVHFYAGGAVATQSLALWSNSTSTIPLKVAQAGKHTIRLEAAGQPCDGVFPLMKLELDGADLGTVTVDANKNKGRRKTFAFTNELTAGAHAFTITFLNDEYKAPEDRNLFLESLSIQPEGGAKQALSFSSPEEMMQKLAASAESLKPRYLDQLDAAQKKHGTALPCVLTEYGVMYGQSLDDLKKSRDLKGALASARLAQIALEDPRFIESNFWCIKSAWFLVIEQGPEAFRYAPSGMALRTLTPLAAGKVVTAEIDGPTNAAAGAAAHAPWINTVAVRDGNTLALNFIAWHPARRANVEVTIAGLAGRQWSGRLLRVEGPGPDAQNEDGKPAEITLKEETIAGGKFTAPLKFSVSLGPCSVTTALITVE